MTRRSASGTEREMQRSLLRLYPGVDAVAQGIYENVMAQQFKHPVHDFSRALDDSREQFFGDLVHLSEAGNRLIAERLAAQIGVRTK
jgi:lysophospholipase L1-like esterase